MKKFIIISCIWFGFVTTIFTGNAKAEVEYQINYDTNTKETFELKDKMQAIYSELVSGVHKDSYIIMVKRNKNKFAYKENMKVVWKKNILRIIEGDGKGDRITGILKASNVCMAEVQPRSFIQEMFNK